jgi:hypothetical protein
MRVNEFTRILCYGYELQFRCKIAWFYRYCQLKNKILFQFYKKLNFDLIFYSVKMIFMEYNSKISNWRILFAKHTNFLVAISFKRDLPYERWMLERAKPRKFEFINRTHEPYPSPIELT